MYKEKKTMCEEKEVANFLSFVKVNDLYRVRSYESMALLTNIIKPDNDDYMTLRKIAIYHIFGRALTYDLLEYMDLIKTCHSRQMSEELHYYFRHGNPVFAGHIPNPCKPKDNRILKACQNINAIVKHQIELLKSIETKNTLGNCFNEFRKYLMVGDQQAYNIAVDLSNTAILNKAEDVFTWGFAPANILDKLIEMGNVSFTQLLALCSEQNDTPYPMTMSDLLRAMYFYDQQTKANEVDE